MDEQRSDPGDFRCLQRARQRITKQGSSKARLMVVFVDRQTAQHHHRDGIRPIAAQGARSIDMAQRTRRKAVVADNGIAHADDISAGHTARLIASGAPFQPVIERRLAAFKRIDNVVVRKRLRRRYHLPVSHGAGAFSNLRSRSVGTGGLSSIA